MLIPEHPHLPVLPVQALRPLLYPFLYLAMIVIVVVPRFYSLFGLWISFYLGSLHSTFNVWELSLRRRLLSHLDSSNFYVWAMCWLYSRALSSSSGRCNSIDLYCLENFLDSWLTIKERFHMLVAGFSVRWPMVFLESIIITSSSLSSFKLFIYLHN